MPLAWLRIDQPVCVQAEEAEATYRMCIADATTQQQELEHVKVNVLRLLQEVIQQSDQTLRSVSILPHTHTYRPWNQVIINRPLIQSPPQHTYTQTNCLLRKSLPPPLSLSLTPT